ncbi:hypothetical protein [Maribacter sp. 2-571]|uniref:hypothetical protein n=1 Tax=Maribacter sp. 2-571 TaxID=3417569 RepID=UPI003D338EB8
MQIRTGLLAMYMLSLPLLLVFHSRTHTQNAISIATGDVDQITVDHDTDCQLCSFYFDQQLYVENSFSYELASSPYYFQEFPVASPVVRTQEQQYLRGPPVV